MFFLVPALVVGGVLASVNPEDLTTAIRAALYMVPLTSLMMLTGPRVFVWLKAATAWATIIALIQLVGIDPIITKVAALFLPAFFFLHVLELLGKQRTPKP